MASLKKQCGNGSSWSTRLFVDGTYLGETAATPFHFETNPITTGPWHDAGEVEGGFRQVIVKPALVTCNGVPGVPLTSYRYTITYQYAYCGFPPSADFVWTTQYPLVDEAITLSSTSTDGDNDIVKVTWDLGDGSGPVDGSSVTHTYREAGMYQVKLTVEDLCGRKSEITKFIAVRDDKDLGNACPQNPAMRGNPCNTGTGNKYEYVVDYSSPTLAFTRSYNSHLKEDVGLGNGWTSPHIRKLRFNNDSIWARRGDGQAIQFRRVGSDWVTDADVGITLTEHTNGYTIQLRDGRREEYNAAGQITQDIAMTGLATTYSYHADGRLYRITGPYGHYLKIYTNPATGRIASFEESPLRYSYSGYHYDVYYDSRGNLTQVRDPNWYSTSYHYEDPSEPRHLTGITNKNLERYATFGYEDTLEKRVLFSQHTEVDNGAPQERYTFAYDSETQTTVTDGNGNVEVLTFRHTLGRTQVVSIVNQGDGTGTSYIYNDNNQLLTKTDAEGHTQSYSYNAAGQLVSVTEAYGTSQARTTTFDYVSPSLDLPTNMLRPSVAEGQLLETTITYQGY